MIHSVKVFLTAGFQFVDKADARHIYEGDGMKHPVIDFMGRSCQTVLFKHEEFGETRTLNIDSGDKKDAPIQGTLGGMQI